MLTTLPRLLFAFTYFRFELNKWLISRTMKSPGNEVEKKIGRTFGKDGNEHLTNRTEDYFTANTDILIYFGSHSPSCNSLRSSFHLKRHVMTQITQQPRFQGLSLPSPLQLNSRRREVERPWERGRWRSCEGGIVCGDSKYSYICCFYKHFRYRKMFNNRIRKRYHSFGFSSHNITYLIKGALRYPPCSLIVLFFDKTLDYISTPFTQYRL